MRLMLIILSFLLLLHKSNANASAVRVGHMTAVKAFVLERKNSDTASPGVASKISREGVLSSAPQLLLCDLEEEEEGPSFDVKKFKLLCGFYLTLPAIRQLLLSCLKPEVIAHEHYNSQIFDSKYIIQRSLRI